MKKIFFILLLLMSGCSAVSKEHDTLYMQYSSYITNVNLSNIQELASQFFSKELLEDLDLNSSSIKRQLLFKNNMMKELSHYEKVADSIGCLSIVGTSKDSMPITFNIEYHLTDSGWKINEIDLFLVERKKELIKTARCPSEYIN